MNGSSGVINVEWFAGAGRRPPKGIRRHNRWAKAVERREVEEAALAAMAAAAEKLAESFREEIAEIKETAQQQPRELRPAHVPLVQIGYKWAFEPDMVRMAKNVRGDCPQCGEFGAHPLKVFKRHDNGAEVRLRECSSCSTRFNDLPKLFEDLPKVKAGAEYNTCPICGDMEVRETDAVESKLGGYMEALKCRKGHLFQPGAQKLPRVEVQLYQLQKVARYQDDDCPTCQSDEHQEVVGVYMGHEVPMMRCDECSQIFGGFHQKRVWESLLASTSLVHNDCPVCHEQNVNDGVIVRSVVSGQQVRAAQCSRGHLFKPGEMAKAPKNTVS